MIRLGQSQEPDGIAGRPLSFKYQPGQFLNVQLTADTVKETQPVDSIHSLLKMRPSPSAACISNLGTLTFMRAMMQTTNHSSSQKSWRTAVLAAISGYQLAACAL